MAGEKSAGAVLMSGSIPSRYRGRLAPSPTGYLHLGHARTFWTAQQRAKQKQGTLVLRIEDLDSDRCKSEFANAIFEDLRWFGFHWDEGPDIGGVFAPYVQSERLRVYAEAMQKLLACGVIYPCTCSRKDVLRALQAPHAADEEPIYAGTCREETMNAATEYAGIFIRAVAGKKLKQKVNWRFRVPDNQPVEFVDGLQGAQKFIAGKDFGDFVVWRHDQMPSYQLAVTVDDAAMKITEVVRGADLLVSTARQLLLYEALGIAAPAFYHCPLLLDNAGNRLAKRHDALSLRQLRAEGNVPEELQARFGEGHDSGAKSSNEAGR
ncbi:MAG TPA: tRNA glutamyl-Q(34) synthetase GluQRS [Verrucomicrobiae bacterium]